MSGLDADKDLAKLQHMSVDNFPSVVKKLLSDEEYKQLAVLNKKDGTVIANAILDANNLGSLEMLETIKDRLLLSRATGGFNLEKVAESVKGLNIREEGKGSGLEREGDRKV